MNDTWKSHVVWCEDGYYTLATEETGNVPVRLFLTAALLEEAEAGIYQQVVNATHFPGVKMVVITPDVHRKGATRAFPAGHLALTGTPWEETGHPILIPGSNKDYSFILRPASGAYKSAYSVNHGSGRRLSRNAARKQFSQQTINAEYREAGILVNTDGNVPIDEAGQCYKSSKEVVEAVVSAGLATIEYTLWPLSSLKGLH